MRLRATAVAAAVGLALVAAPASSQTVVSDNGTLFDADALTGFATLGSMMDGMTVTGWTADGLSSTMGSWADLGGGLHGVQNPLFSLTLGTNTNTFNNPWTLASQSGLSRLVFMGGPGNTIFDRYLCGGLHGLNLTQDGGGGVVGDCLNATGAGAVSTPGSANGNDFRWDGGDNWNTTATYQNAVGVGGAPPVVADAATGTSDIFAQVDITFGTTFATSAGFFMDTDNAVSSLVPTDPPTRVPEPASALLMVGGLLLLVGLRREELFGQIG